MVELSWFHKIIKCVFIQVYGIVKLAVIPRNSVKMEPLLFKLTSNILFFIKTRKHPVDYVTYFLKLCYTSFAHIHLARYNRINWFETGLTGKDAAGDYYHNICRA